MNQIKIGNFIKELRKEQKLTQEALAEKFGVARRTVSRWETGSLWSCRIAFLPVSWKAVQSALR